ncbi:MAG: TonB-dependent receptor, partial [Bacteroidales bacterium]|nr:TonB-dependent receptor [Bacteroidales bacterium]
TTPSEISSETQQSFVNGTVTDESGLPLPGVAVFIKGSTRGTITIVEGKYSLSLDDPSTTVLVFSFVGYLSQEVLVGNQTIINVSLGIDIIGLEEVVAIGYGTQRRNDLTGAITSVNAEQIESTLSTNLLKTLQGTVPGLRITQNSFAPGSSQEIRIRGENSLSASNVPLIIVDGIPYEGNLNDINPSDIESVSILKDASSAAIYGARAANGVMLITTKMGKSGELAINYNGSTGVSSIMNRSIKVLDGEGYIKMNQERIRYEEGVANKNPLDWMYANELPQYQAGTETDWMDLVLRNAIQQDHNISISGGTEKTTHYTSIGYLDQPGIIVNSGFKRATLRSNIRHDVKDWLTIGTSLQLSNTDYGSPGATPNIMGALRMSPYGKLKEENGDYTIYPQYPETFYTSPFANDAATIDDLRKRAMINTFAEIKPAILPGLMYRINYGTDLERNNAGSYYPSNTSTGLGVDGLATVSNGARTQWTFENILQYTRNWRDHNLTILGLYSRESQKSEDFYSEGWGFLNDDNLYYYLESAETKNSSSYFSETKLISYLGRINYDYAKKYLITLTTRRDGYSGFGTNNKFGVFPSIALGWTITNEDFAQNWENLDFLKLRISYGINGNMGVIPYQTLDRFAAANTLFGDNTTVINGLKLSAVGNPDLKWEGTINLNTGIDFAFLDNKISGALDVYQSNSNDLLMTRLVPSMNGYSSIWYNIGEVENKGVELRLNTRNIDKGNFQWVTSFSFSLNRDKIVELRGDGIDDIANNWYIGEPLRVNFGYEFDGLWQPDELAKFQAYAPEGTFELHLGRDRVKDSDGDGEITEEDRVILGSQLPSWIGSMSNELSYKNWSLFVFVNAVQGLGTPNGWYDPISFFDEKKLNFLDVPYWTPERTNTEYFAPALTFDGGYPAASARPYDDASFVRIQNVTLSYTVPATSINKLGLNKLRIYISANNLATFTSYLGFDPESIGSLYPSARTFTFGINLGL